MQLLNDVDATNQLPLDIELRVSGPVGILLEPLSNLVVLKNVEVVELKSVVLVQ